MMYGPTISTCQNVNVLSWILPRYLRVESLRTSEDAGASNTIYMGFPGLRISPSQIKNI